VEIALIFAVFFLQGAWPVPDVNEPHYLGKAIHFWNPNWVGEDFFLDSADTHWVFNITFGWVSLILPPAAMAWSGRLVTWALLAWAWRRLSVAVLPRPWYAVLSAALFAGATDWFHMAGEWVIGGVEAKGFAYILVLLGLEALVQGHWSRVWLLLGGASFFHVLVGGWSVVAAAVAWLWSAGDRPPLRSMVPALLGGWLLSLPGLIPAARLDWGASPEHVAAAHQIYVFQRLSHHLDLGQFPAHYVVRFVALIVAFGLVVRMVRALDERSREAQEEVHREPRATPSTAAPGCRRLVGFVVGALAIALAGAAINVSAEWNRPLAAGLLRFYWYRLSDVAVPLGAALHGVALIHGLGTFRPRAGRAALAAAVLLASLHVGHYALRRPMRTPPRADQWVSYVSWKLACNWIVRSGEIPAQARFLTPRQSQSFKWYTGRSEVVTWKDIPQDAASIVQWWRRLREIHGTSRREPGREWRKSLVELGPARLKRLAQKYGAQYVLTEYEPKGRIKSKPMYHNRWYAVYRVQDLQ
jgi:hypothetical protein